MFAAQGWSWFPWKRSPMETETAGWGHTQQDAAQIKCDCDCGWRVGASRGPLTENSYLCVGAGKGPVLIKNASCGSCGRRSKTNFVLRAQRLHCCCGCLSTDFSATMNCLLILPSHWDHLCRAGPGTTAEREAESPGRFHKLPHSSAYFSVNSSIQVHL